MLSSLESRERALWFGLPSQYSDRRDAYNWWANYPAGGYLRPQFAYDQYEAGIKEVPRRLARSRSITAIRRVPVDISSGNLSRSISYSQLPRSRSASPSRQLTPTPSLSPFMWTPYEPSRPQQQRLQRPSYVPQYVNSVRKIYSTPPLHEKYVTQSDDYRRRYMVAQTYMPGTYVPYVYKPLDYGRRISHFIGSSGLYMSVPTGLPSYTWRAWHPRTAFRLNERYYKYSSGYYPFVPRVMSGPGRLGMFYWSRNPTPSEWDKIDWHPRVRMSLTARTRYI